MFVMRPLPSCARYRTPIRGLFLCGSGVHPGGGVLGVSRYNAAPRDFEVKPAWPLLLAQRGHRIDPFAARHAGTKQAAKADDKERAHLTSKQIHRIDRTGCKRID